MNRKWLIGLLVVAILAGIAGAALSVAMVISAVQFSEWGRVFLYSVTLAVCVEMTLLAIAKLKSKENS